MSLRLLRPGRQGGVVLVDNEDAFHSIPFHLGSACSLPVHVLR